MKSIHDEKEIKQVDDKDLMKKLLFFAKPYWKILTLSLIVAAVIVLTTLLQPYLVKVAIDDRLNGAYKPMLVYQGDDEPFSKSELQDHGWKIDAVLEAEGRTYYRVNNHADKQGDLEGLALSKAQIINVDRHKVMIQDWLLVEEAGSIRLTGAGSDQPMLVAGGYSYSAEIIDAEQLQSFREGDFTGLLWLGVFFLVIVVAGAFLNYAQMNMMQNAGQKVIYDIRQRMFEHLAKLQTSFFDRNPAGRLVTRVAHDVEALNNLYSQVIVNMVKEVCMLFGIVAFMLFLSVELTLVSFVIIPVLVAVTFYYRTKIRGLQRHVRTLLSRLNSFLAENLSGMRIIQIFIREKRQYNEFEAMNEEYYKAGMKTSTLNSIFQPTIMFIGNIAMAAIVWYGGNKVLGGTITFGVVFAFITYIQQFYRPLMSLADRYGQIQTAMASAERIFELLEEKPTIENHPQAKRFPAKIPGRIEFQNVWFAYNKDEWVLKDVSFTVEPGQTVAFVGATGAGKSSIISLINRFYDIQKGSIKIDNEEIRNIAIDNLRKHVAIIQQDPFIFTGDVRYNIKLNRDMTEEELIEAAKSLNMHDFIMKLPQQYDTMLGEQGYTLSSGQKQLLSFLRAAVYNPDILILDEATANIDTETEIVVQDALKRISKDRTTLIVAHRLSTIQHADKIIVLKKGEIQEVGNHKELLKNKGYYHRLFEVQQQKEQEQKQRVSV